MYLMILFLFLMVVTIVLTFLQLIGFQVLDSIIIMVIVDFLVLGANIELERRKIKDLEVTINSIENKQQVKKSIFKILKGSSGYEKKGKHQKK